MANHHISELPAVCPCCGGDGGWDDFEMHWSKCWACEGTGQVESFQITLDDLIEEPVL